MRERSTPHPRAAPLQSNQVSNTRSAAVGPGTSLATGGITVLADTTTTLELVGETINDSGGSASTAQWSFSATGSDGVPGSFDLSQVGPEGYALTSLSCNNANGQVTSVVLAIGAEIVCTFVNDDLVPPVECGVGTFSATGVEPCDDAPAGSYVAEAGATGATRCATGSYQPLTAQSSCDPAPAGSFVDTEGATQATLCPVGAFSDSAGAVACTPAPAGSFVATTGATAATDCPVGTSSAVTGAVACTPAPVGSFVDTAGATAATPCPAGETTAGVGSTSVDDCFPIDTDGDGVADVDDVCPGTVLPDVPTQELKKNRFAASLDGFASVDGVVIASLADTGGCSGTQIIAEAGLGNGHSKFGISRSALQAWIDTVNA